MSTKTTQLLSSGEFFKLRYDTIPDKSASANVSVYTNDSKMLDFELWHYCRKWAIYSYMFRHLYVIIRKLYICVLPSYTNTENL